MFSWMDSLLNSRRPGGDVPAPKGAISFLAEVASPPVCSVSSWRKIAVLPENSTALDSVILKSN